jgi:hypothetical protein
MTAAAPIVSYRSSEKNSADRRAGTSSASPGGMLKTPVKTTAATNDSKSRTQSPSVPRLNINKAIQPRRDQQQRAKAGVKA